MKPIWMILLVLMGCGGYAAPQGRAREPRKGVDLLSSEYFHDARGHLLVVVPSKTPFDADAESRKRYQTAFVAGCKSGYAGVLSPYHTPLRGLRPGELEGWSAGQWSGYRAYQKETIRSPKSG